MDGKAGRLGLGYVLSDRLCDGADIGETASIIARFVHTLRTAESTNLQATHIAFSNMDRLPRACGACREHLSD